MKNSSVFTCVSAYLLFSILSICISTSTFAQEDRTPLDTLTNFTQKIASDVFNTKKLKISGYVQAQYQIADTAGAASYAGGNFPATLDNRFSVRRGRFKFLYDGSPYTQLVMQVDVTEKGVGIKDAYARVAEPFLNAFSLTAGVQDRPFGFEISYSSNNRESPERSRLFQTIFPGERDLGAKLTFQAPKGDPWNILKIDAGFYNGTGNTAVDFDNKKDFISHIALNRTTLNEKISYGFGASYYDGGVRQATKNIYSYMTTDASGLNKFTLDNSTSNVEQFAKRQYWGLDAQVSFESPLGFTTFRAEYIEGTQPGTAATTVSPAVDPAADTYLRKFNGAYFNLIQTLGARHKIIAKYDWYDPNTQVEGNDIGKANSFTSKTDIKYNTLGLGYIFNYDTNVKFVVYYDIVTNETSANLKGYNNDLKDNVWTFRMQYKF